jgi:hypothetical protein
MELVVVFGSRERRTFLGAKGDIRGSYIDPVPYRQAAR